MMPSNSEQRKLLTALKDGGGYGILCIVSPIGFGDTVCAVSPVPDLVGYEVVCASPERLYDIWKDGRLVVPNQTREQIRTWIHANTPKWLYDDSVVTDKQKRLVAKWVDALRRRYPGTLDLG